MDAPFMNGGAELFCVGQLRISFTFFPVDRASILSPVESMASASLSVPDRLILHILTCHSEGYELFWHKDVIIYSKT